MRDVAIKRIYDSPTPDDGFRVLVDRVWPRGVSKKAAAIDHWAKDITPSSELRKWFNHDPARWDAFRRRYRAELDDRREALQGLVEVCGNRRMTLLFAAKDTERNNAVVLKELLEEKGAGAGE